jgi:hypothetical protein
MLVRQSPVVSRNRLSQSPMYMRRSVSQLHRQHQGRQQSVAPSERLMARPPHLSQWVAFGVVPITCTAACWFGLDDVWPYTACLQRASATLLGCHLYNSSGTPARFWRHGRQSIKNETELAGMREAHLRDAVAIVQFLTWLDEKANSFDARCFTICMVKRCSNCRGPHQLLAAGMPDHDMWSCVLSE